MLLSHGSCRCHMVLGVGGGLPSCGSAEELIWSRSDQKCPVGRFLAGKGKIHKIGRGRFFFLHSGHTNKSVFVSCGYYDRTPDQGLRDNRNLLQLWNWKCEVWVVLARALRVAGTAWVLTQWSRRRCDLAFLVPPWGAASSLCRVGGGGQR